MTSPPKPMHHGRRLFELLEEQQEPFLLDVYLLEHGYSDREIRANATFMCWPGIPCRKLRKFCTYGFKRKRAGILRFLLNKVVYNKVIKKAWGWDSVAFGSGRWSILGSVFEMKGQRNAVEFHRLSYSGRTEEGELDKGERWRSLGSSTQLSPVSVLEQHSDEAGEELQSTSSFNSPKETKEDSWVGWEEFLYSSCYVPQNANTNKHLFEPHHFVCNCLRQVEGRCSASHECSSLERRGRIIQEKILSWEHQRVGLANISQLIDSDFSKSRQEWSHFQHEMREVVTEIEHLIFEEIGEETFLDILDCHCILEKS